HCAGRGGGCAEGFELVFGGLGRQPFNDGDAGAAAGADEVAEDGVEDVFVQQVVRKVGEAVEDLAAAVFWQVQAGGGGAAGERGADVDEVAVAVGARAEDGVGEDDGVA